MNIMLFFHILLLTCIIAIIYISITEIRIGNRGMKLFFLGCIILCIFSLMDMFDFYFSSIPGLNAQSFLQFAILLFVILLSASLGHYVLDIFNEQTRNKIYKTLAYTDMLTGLENRTSFEEISKVYRIGGDEFAVIVTEFVESIVMDKLLTFDRKINEYNCEKTHPEIADKMYGECEPYTIMQN